MPNIIGILYIISSCYQQGKNPSLLLQHDEHVTKTCNFTTLATLEGSDDSNSSCAAWSWNPAMLMTEAYTITSTYPYFYKLRYFNQECELHELWKTLHVYFGSTSKKVVLGTSGRSMLLYTPTYSYVENRCMIAHHRWHIFRWYLQILVTVLLPCTASGKWTSGVDGFSVQKPCDCFFFISWWWRVFQTDQSQVSFLLLWQRIIP